MHFVTKVLVMTALASCSLILFRGGTAFSDDRGSAADVKLIRLNWKQLQERLVNRKVKVHDCRCLVNHLWPLQGQLSACDRDAS